MTIANHERLQLLAHNANREHAFIQDRMRTTLEAAYRIGLDLIEARTELQRANLSWTKWVEDNLVFKPATARIYTRLATYQDTIPDDMGINEAYIYIRGLPPASCGVGVALPPEVRTEAMRLLNEGLSQADVSRALDIAPGTVKDWANGQTAKRNVREKAARRAKKARAALKREDDAKLARKAGGNVSKGYTHIRNAIQEIDRARLSAEGEKKQHLDQCLYRLNAAEDEIGKALRS